MGGINNYLTGITGKRVFDIIFVIVLLVPVLILVIVFSIIIIFDIQNFPLYFQKRGITKAKTFYLLKLRTLKRTKGKIQVDIFDKRGLLSCTTSFCLWLRNSGMDELPQFLNILLGQMSVVGPRPFSLNDLERMRSEMPEYYNRRSLIASKPGLTGLWQICANRTLGASNLLELEEEYERTKSISVDIRIILNTIPFILNGRKNYRILREGTSAPKLRVRFNTEEYYNKLN